MARLTNRREFIQASAGAGLLVLAKSGWAQEARNERIAFACVGIGGKGESDSGDCGKHGDVVAICDIDGQRLQKAQGKFAKAKAFSDFREMITQMEKSFDAITVSDLTRLLARVRGSA